MDSLKSTGWVLLSIILALGLFSVAEVLSIRSLHLEAFPRSIIIFAALLIQALIVRYSYSLIGPIVLIIVYTAMSIGKFESTNFLMLSMIILGTFAGIVFRKKLVQKR